MKKIIDTETNKERKATIAEELEINARKKLEGYKWEGLSRDSFDSLDAYKDYKEALENLRTVLSAKKAEKTNAKALTAVLLKCGISLEYTDKFSFVLYKFNANKVDYSTPEGITLKGKREELNYITDKLEGADYIQPLERLDLVKKAEALKSEVSDMLENSAVYSTKAFFTVSAETFRKQFELQMGYYLVNANPLETAVHDGLKRLVKKADKIGIPADAVKVYVVANNYYGLKRMLTRYAEEAKKAEEAKAEKLTEETKKVEEIKEAKFYTIEELTIMTKNELKAVVEGLGIIVKVKAKKIEYINAIQAKQAEKKNPSAVA